MADQRTVLRFWSKVNKYGPVPEHCPELGPCWVWTAAKGEKGYGRFWFAGSMRLSHRVAFFLEESRWPTPDGMHLCDNPVCVRRSHIKEGTHAENNADKAAKGRLPTGDAHWTRRHPELAPMRVHPERAAKGNANGSRLHPERLARGDRNGSRLHPDSLPRGEKHGNAVLTSETVRAIRSLSGVLSQRLIASRFNVSQGAVASVVTGRTWGHVDG